MTQSHKSTLRRWFKGFMLKRVHGMITCREFEDFVAGYLDGELTNRQSTVFERHMRICRECRDYLAAYRRSIELGRAVFSSPDDMPPEDVPQDLIRAVLEARKS